MKAIHPEEGSYLFTAAIEYIQIPHLDDCA
jgi:hypothetical protein